MAMLNTAILDTPNTLTQAQLDTVAGTLRETGSPFSIQMFSENKRPESDGLLTANGYTVVYDDPVVYCTNSLNVESPNLAVEVHEVLTAEDQAVYRQVVTSGFNLRPTVQEFVETLLSMRECYHFTARLNGQPLGVGTLFICKGIAGIYNLTTLPEARRQGVAARLLAAMHERAQAEGISGSGGAAAAAGMSLYTRLGYRIYGYQIVYVPPQSHIIPMRRNSDNG
jgi:GNAT superfamily N-acetyltransferase